MITVAANTRPTTTPHTADRSNVVTFLPSTSRWSSSNGFVFQLRPEVAAKLRRSFLKCLVRRINAGAPHVEAKYLLAGALTGDLGNALATESRGHLTTDQARDPVGECS